MKANRVDHIFDKDQPVPGDFAFYSDIDGEDAGVLLCCPGCHNVLSLAIRSKDRPRWSWDGNRDAPTLNPSINHVGCWHGWLKAGELTQ